MQHERAMNILTGQSKLACKVFESVPKQEFWSIGQISNEMDRKEKHNVSKGEITGCLRSLVDAGLVTEAGQLTFRSNVKPPKLTIPKEAPVQPKEKPAAPKPTFIDRAFELATTLRTAAEQLEKLGMEVDTALKDAGKGDEKFRQMQETLRGLLGGQNG